MHSLWTEKYRPKEFEDVVGQEHIVASIKNFVEAKQVPHLLFAGPAGCGKSTLALIIARKLFGEFWRQNFLELNASDERGIAVVRIKIKDFARTRSVNAPFKIIFLDEADALTSEAQNALRRTMETYSEGCRFIMGCNYSSKIIEPIQSRCAVFRFKSISPNEIVRRLKIISEKENLSADEAALESLAKISSGDIRRAINLLQACASLSGGKISEEAVYKVALEVQPKEVLKMIRDAAAGNFLSARQQLQKILSDGTDGSDLVKEVGRQILNGEFSEQQKAKLIERVGEFEWRIAQGGDPQVQLEAMLAQMAISK